MRTQAGDFSTRATQIRWWPAALLLAIYFGGLAVIWLRDAPNRQMQVLPTLGVTALLAVLLLLWLLFFSGLPRKIRWIAAGAAVGMVVLFAAFFRVRGVSGDFVPILEWRWRIGSATVETSAPPVLVADPPGEYPQFLGPGRNATITGVTLVRDWQMHPPKEIWRRPVGAGWSGFAVKDGLAVTQEQREGQEWVVCYGLKTGAMRWQHADPGEYTSTVAGDGPRATPTIVGDRVYSAGVTGHLNCLDLASGARIWSRNYLTENGAPRKKWGNSGSPLVVDSLVIINAGGPDGYSLVAYHRDSGERLWHAGSDPAGHSSPMLATLCGVPQVIVFNEGSIVGHDPARRGAILWQHPWPRTTQPVAQPLLLPGHRLFVSSGYGIGGRLFQLARDDQGKFSVTELWKTSRMKAKFTNLVHREGYIYGLDDGVLACIDAATGQRRWKRGRYGHGQLILVEDVLLIQAEDGELVLVEATPETHRELATMPALNAKTWNNPTLAAPYLLVRNDREAICYQLAVQLLPQSHR